jgi:hypothetical protein
MGENLYNSDEIQKINLFCTEKEIIPLERTEKGVYFAIRDFGTGLEIAKGFCENLPTGFRFTLFIAK